jgi:hypothetical protein
VTEVAVVSDGDSSGSPSPPPVVKKRDSKRNYRIPRKKGGGDSPSFLEEGPHVEFNKGKKMPKESKKRAAAATTEGKAAGANKEGGKKFKPNSDE